jgi:ABC-2 type transport system ATP-binding protein
MDEAERCHKLGYILYGQLLAQGTAAEIIASQHLATWEASGPGLAQLATQLRGLPGVDQVSAFGTALHVTGTDAAQLESALAPFRNMPETRWQQIEPGLEDVFINLMNQTDTRYPAPEGAKP